MTSHIQKINRVFRPTTNQQGEGIMKKIASLTTSAIVVGILSSLCMGTAQAATLYWKTNTVGNWNTLANWSVDWSADPVVNQLPVSGDTPRINVAGTDEITVTTNVALGTGQFISHVSNSTVVLDGTAAPTWSAKDIWLSTPKTATRPGFIVEGGTVSLTGSISLSWANTGNVKGWFQQQAGTVSVTGNVGLVGNTTSGNVGRYDLEGGSLSANNIYLGNNGTRYNAVFNQTGGTTTVNTQVRLGYNMTASSTGAQAIYNLDGGTLTIKGDTPFGFTQTTGVPVYFDFDGGTLNVKASAVTDFASLTAIPNSDFRVGGDPATANGLDFTATTIGGVAYTQITLPNLTWDGGSDDWTASNWTRAGFSEKDWIPKANATFNTSDANPETITLVGDISVNNLTFSGGGPYLIQDNSGDGADSLTIKNSTTVGSGVMATVTANVTAADVAVNGTLIVNGTLDAATVNVAGTLGGSGTITGNVVISDGGIMAPGNSPGVLTVDGNLNFVDTVLAGVPIYNWEVSNADEYDQVFVKNGTLTIADTLVINLTTFEPKRTLGETFVLFDFTDNASFAGDPSLWTVNVLGPYMSGTPQITQVDNQIILSGINFIPEPSTAILAGLGLAGLVLRRRR